MLNSENIIKRVAEVGILACELGRLDDADIIFDGIANYAEDSEGKTAAKLGLAASKIARGDFDSGIQLLSEELEAVDYENMEALAILVYALKSNGQYKEAESLIPKLEGNPAFHGSVAEEALLSIRS